MKIIKINLDKNKNIPLSEIAKQSIGELVKCDESIIRIVLASELSDYLTTAPRFDITLQDKVVGEELDEAQIEVASDIIGRLTTTGLVLLFNDLAGGEVIVTDGLKKVSDLSYEEFTKIKKQNSVIGRPRKYLTHEDYLEANRARRRNNTKSPI